MVMMRASIPKYLYRKEKEYEREEIAVVDGEE